MRIRFRNRLRGSVGGGIARSPHRVGLVGGRKARPYGSDAGSVVGQGLALSLILFALLFGCSKEAPSPPPPADPSSVSVDRPAAVSPAVEEAAPGPEQASTTGACTSPDTCYRSARASMKRGQAKAARRFFETACNQGHGGACFQIGAMYRDGKGVEPSDETARQWFEQACQAGSTSGCDALGH